MAVATKTPEKHDAVEKHENAEKDTAPPEQKGMLPGKELPILKDLLLPSTQAFDDLTVDPDAVQGSRHIGPLLSGAPEDGSAGIAILHKRAKLLFSQTITNVPIRFAPSSILTQVIVQVQTAYNGTTPVVNIGTSLGGSNVANQTVAAQGQFFTNVNAILPSDWTVYLSQVGGGSTAGKCTVMILYSVPAKTMSS
jgi:hypothetical protein